MAGCVCKLVNLLQVPMLCGEFTEYCGLPLQIPPAFLDSLYFRIATENNPFRKLMCLRALRLLIRRVVPGTPCLCQLGPWSVELGCDVVWSW